MNRLNSIHPVTEALNQTRIAELELKLGIDIHPDLKDILLNYNVVKPTLTYLKENKIEFNVDYLFGFSENEYEDFESNYNIYLERIPNEMLPMGCVDGADLLCIDNLSGEIYYWFHEEDDWGLEGNSKYPTLVSNNLRKYFDSLVATKTPTTDEFERVKREGKTLHTSNDFDDLFSEYLIDK